MGTFDVVHYEVVNPLMFAHMVNTNNSRMVKFTHDTGFIKETLAEIGIFAQLIWQNLKGIAFLVVNVLCQIHLAHATGSDGLQDVIITDCLVNILSHSTFL